MVHLQFHVSFTHRSTGLWKPSLPVGKPAFHSDSASVGPLPFLPIQPLGNFISNWSSSKFFALLFDVAATDTNPKITDKGLLIPSRDQKFHPETKKNPEFM
jgi:hypothetical protein